MSSELQIRKDEEYEMQLLGFTSRGVYTTVENVAAEKVKSCCRKLCEPLQRIHTGNENCAAIIRNDEKNLTKLYFSHSKPHKEAVKKCIRKLITVPKNVLLKEDIGQSTQYSEKEFQKIGEDLKYLQSQAQEATVLHAALQEELDQLAEFEQLIHEAETISSVIENSTMHAGVDDETVNCVERCQIFEETLEKAIQSSPPHISTTIGSNVSSKDVSLRSP